MEASLQRLQFIVIVILFFFFQPMIGASTSIETSQNNFQQHTAQDSLTIDRLILQLQAAKPTQKTKIIKGLRKFKYANFTNKHKSQLAYIALGDHGPSQELILLIGFLKMETTLETLAEKHKDHKSLLQYINIALVRAGNFSKAKNLRKNIEKFPVNDPFVYEILPLLTYTKQPIIYDWLLDQIALDEKNCHPADAEISGNINCAFRIMEAVAPQIVDFPIQLDDWGDLAVDSYSKALTTVRDWIIANENTYTLDTQTY